MKSRLVFVQLFFLFISFNSNSQVGCISGDCNDGQGTYIWDDGGEKYIGEFKNGQFNGYGTYTWTNGDKYSGEFKDNLRKGQGVIIWASGAKYSGEWVNERMQVQCIYTNSNKATWTGYWKSN